MPIYEYQCKSCGERFEKLIRTITSTQEPKADCPKCGSAQTSRALSVFAVGGEGAGKSSSSSASDAPMCGRCGGPGPCAMG